MVPWTVKPGSIFGAQILKNYLLFVVLILRMRKGIWDSRPHCLPCWKKATDLLVW
jgi:hypothetical protein